MVLAVVYSLISSIQYIIACSVLDFLLFLCADKASGLLISQCRSLEEKRSIWIFESLGLFALSFFVYFYHHSPVILWTFAAITFLSGTLTGHVDFLYYWETLKTYWYEFKDQEEVITVTPVAEPIYTNRVSEEQCQEYLRKTGEVIINNQNGIDTSGVDENLRTLRYNPQTLKFEYVGSHTQRRVIAAQKQASNHNDGPGQTVRRRALHSQAYLGNTVSSVMPPPNEPRQPSTVLESLEDLGNRVWHAISGSQTSTPPVPPGLKNGGKNLCFFNSVLQCISHAPNFADEFAEDTKSCQTTDKIKQLLLDASASVMQQLNQLPSVTSPSLVETADLIRAGSALNPDLLNNYQNQQDACEFLTWFLYELHDVINEGVKDGKGRVRADEAMNKLKTVYGNISEQYLAVMKTECRQQISSMNGLNDPNLAEPLQNLSSMEWLSHKRENSSVIDDMFTFQLIELKMCSKCCHSTANVQTMNVLSLPIPSTTDMCSIPDCLKLFVDVEKLEGREGLQCDKCQTLDNTTAGVGNIPGPRQVTRKTASSILAATSLSPIPSDTRKVCSSTNILSSTPLPGASKASKATKVGRILSSKVITAGIRRCFLRRLQECVIIHLLRFCYNPFTKKVEKILTPVNLSRKLDLLPYTFDSAVSREDMTDTKDGNNYQLFAICLHIGGERTSSGHYLCYSQAADSKWYKFDDENVSMVEDIEGELNKPVVQENCYLLYYRKQHASSEA